MEALSWRTCIEIRLVLVFLWRGLTHNPSHTSYLGFLDLDIEVDRVEDNVRAPYNTT